jgi:tRNA 2-thiouridine synthesizing protein A
MHSDGELNCEGLQCPMPILKAKKALMRLEKGQVLLIIATDLAAPQDFRAFCQQTGHTLLQMSEEAGFFKFWIQRC